MAKSTNHYVDNKKLYTEMVKYINKVNEIKETGGTKDQYPAVSNYVGECIWLIATRLATRPNFNGYSYKDEMIGDAIENCLMYIYNFNPEKSSNPFAYFTRIMYFAFIRRIQKEQKQQYIKQKSMIETSTISSLCHSSHNDMKHINTIQQNMSANMDTYNNYAEKFEKKKNEAKKKKLTKKGIDLFIEEEDEQ